VGLHRVDFALETRAHRAARAIEQRAWVGDAALAQLGELAHAAGEDALHGAGHLGILGCGGVQIVEAGAGPEIALEFLVERIDALDRKQLAQDGRPACDRHAHQQQHDELDRPARVQHQLQDRQFIAHVDLLVPQGS